MPTIDVSEATLKKLVGKLVTEKDLEYVKGELDGKEKGMLRIELNDTNRPDLWCVEGIARVLRGVVAKKHGLPTIKTKKSGKKVIVDKKMKSIRPCMVGLIAKNVRLTDEFLKELIQLQAKLDENYGRKRKRVSIGIQDYSSIVFPVYFGTGKPTETFIPLGHDKPLSLKDILSIHKKGVEYGHLVKDYPEYPLLRDATGKIISMSPIINSASIGHVTPGMSELFIDITGTDLNAIVLTLNILAYTLADRGASIETVDVVYSDKKITTPDLSTQTLTFSKTLIEPLLGNLYTDAEIKNLLESMQYNVRIVKDQVTVEIPPYRNDVMHPNDVIEDLAIAAGFDSIKPLPLTAYTPGSLAPLTAFTMKTRSILTGLGFQEIFSPLLTNNEQLTTRMNIENNGIVEIENVMNDNYAVLRSWLLPGLLAFFSKNLHVEYPQYIFEYGECETIKNGEPVTTHRLSLALSHSQVSYDAATTALDALLRSLGISYQLHVSEHDSFLRNRCAKIVSRGKEIGVIGEIHPQVLQNWKLEKPIVAFELDIDALFELC